MLRAVFFLMLLGLPLLPAETKPRVLVLTDISNEPDDEESLVRFLLYANEFEVEGLVATTSVWLRDRIRPDIIRETVAAYGQVRANLLLHAPGYPETEKLLGVIKSGQTGFGMEAVGEGRSTEGSKWIIEVVDRPDPRPVWVPVWGGANTLAQALWDVKYSRSPEELEKFVAKLRVYTISDQDDASRWLRVTFPGLFFIGSPTDVLKPEYWRSTWSGIGGDRHYRNAPGENFHLVDNPWLKENIIENHGPLGARYPLVAYIMEGDTPSFLNLIPNGLAGDVSPSYGGWGGRYELRRGYGETRPIWTDARDTLRLSDNREHTSNQATIWRWREAYQNDFAARMDWCVQPRNAANHNPAAVLNGIPGRAPVEAIAKAGAVLALSALGSTDPDGNRLTYRWFVYPEAGTLREAASARVEKHDSAEAQLHLPAKVQRGGTVHVILEVTDSGTPRLTSYRRLIVQVTP
ncbi:MAG TPA: DUF1593 domain-containing protein [Bryobacteraceae bacterium]|mgnify:FL=1|nr:hypothetical protein [Bryobacterales bacterium]HRJ17610.1 DUF1593 domain-containing protein [Bryobacteraceae bacterium]